MKKEKKYFKKILIDMGMFDYDIYVIISNNKTRVGKYVNDYYKAEDGILRSPDNELGICYSKDGYCPVIWIPKFPKSPKEYGTLAHEAFHAVFYMTKWASIKINEATEEVIAHAVSYIVGKTLEKAKK